MSGFISRLANSLKSGTSSSAASSNATPSFFYKVYPHTTIDPFFFFPVPIHASHEFRPTAADAKDGFVHLCSKDQLGDVLEKWFQDVGKVSVLKVDAPRLCGFKIVKWENGFPHLYGFLEGEYIDSFKDVDKSGASWEEAVEKLKRQGWLE
ncbi:hypothetical protein OIV83_003292 [Microbotryomycetes sp. JL201]|nr:hypothetical protein OIV83_003292 [Microbotryomycetes sp. JL201]